MDVGEKGSGWQTLSNRVAEQNERPVGPDVRGLDLRTGRQIQRAGHIDTCGDRSDGGELLA